MKIEILAGDDCFNAIDNNDFIYSWQVLAQQSEYFTLNQEYNFAASWYHAYRKQYNPIIVIAYDDQEKNMVGIMPLALNYDNSELTHAGDGQAEYDGWICQPRYEYEFIIAALIQINNTLSIKQWNWTWLPPKHDHAWIKSKRLKEAGIYLHLDYFESPLYKLSDRARLDKIKKKKSIKSKINRLNRSGELKIERITESERASVLMDRIIKQSNFRNCALYNKMPFMRDHFRRDWYLKKIAMPNNNEHFTVLWQGDNLLACNFGSCSNNTVLIGTFTYDPLQGGNSPGKIFIIKLIEYLMDEGYDYLDLTPGGDAYKESLCNRHSSLVKPSICFDYSTYIKIKLLNTSKQRLKNKLNGKITNRDIENIKALREKKLTCVLKRELLNLYNNKSNNKNNLLTYTDRSFGFRAKNKIAPINIQKYDDLFLYKNTNGYLTNKEVIFDALKKFERGDTLYTMAYKDTLMAFLWVARSGKKHWHPCLADRINTEKKAVYLYDLYVNRNYQANLIFKLLFAEIVKTVKTENPSNVYFIKSLDVSLDTFKQVGFKLPQLSTNNKKEYHYE